MKTKKQTGSDSRVFRPFTECFEAAIGNWSGDPRKAYNEVIANGLTNQLRDLIDWLNQNHKTGSGIRVINLIEAIQALEHAYVEDKDKNLQSGLEKRIDQMLSLYSLRPRLSSFGDPHPKEMMSPSLNWSFGLQNDYLSDEAAPLKRTIALSEAAKALVNYIRAAGLPGARQLMLSEGDAVLILAGITQRGDAERLRKCVACSKWFYATPRHKKLCTLRCKDTKQSTPEYKKEMATRMRKYRREIREGKRKIKRREQF